MSARPEQRLFRTLPHGVFNPHDWHTSCLVKCSTTRARHVSLFRQPRSREGSLLWSIAWHRKYPQVPNGGQSPFEKITCSRALFCRDPRSLTLEREKSFSPGATTL